jgi:hypothetical protein
MLVSPRPDLGLRLLPGAAETLSLLSIRPPEEPSKEVN